MVVSLLFVPFYVSPVKLFIVVFPNLQGISSKIINMCLKPWAVMKIHYGFFPRNFSYSILIYILGTVRNKLQNRTYKLV